MLGSETVGPDSTLLVGFLNHLGSRPALFSLAELSFGGRASARGSCNPLFTLPPIPAMGGC